MDFSFSSLPCFPPSPQRADFSLLNTFRILKGFIDFEVSLNLNMAVMLRTLHGKYLKFLQWFCFQGHRSYTVPSSCGHGISTKGESFQHVHRAENEKINEERNQSHTERGKFNTGKQVTWMHVGPVFCLNTTGQGRVQHQVPTGKHHGKKRIQ